MPYSFEVSAGPPKGQGDAVSASSFQASLFRSAADLVTVAVTGIPWTQYAIGSGRRRKSCPADYPKHAYAHSRVGAHGQGAGACAFFRKFDKRPERAQARRKPDPISRDHAVQAKLLS